MTFQFAEEPEKQIEAEKPTPYVAIPFIVLTGLGFVWIMALFVLTLLNMADWLPSVVWEDSRYRGSEAITEVYQMFLTRVLLVVWPILSVICLVGERQDRKTRAAAV